MASEVFPNRSILSMKTFLFALSMICFTFTYHSALAQELNSSNLPIIIIETDDEIPDEPKISGSMGIIYNGDGQINQISDAFTEYEGNIAIETRGNSTQGFDKKTYSIELRDNDDNDLTANLFDMGGEEDWILHAMVIDKSQIRIPMSFYLAQRMGNYATDWKYVELILNDEYQGLYILTEKIKRDDDRVDIAKLDSDDIAGDSVTGGYILRIDWLDEFDDDQGFESDYESQSGDPMTFQWYYPKAENIQEQQAEYIQDWMSQFEEALFSSNYFNENGQRYTDYIDLNAFVDFLIINELSKNADGYKLSSYVHKDKDSKGGRLKAGPIWDFDQTYGVSLVCSNHLSYGWTYQQNQNDCEDLESMPLWWQAMMEDTVFQNRLHCRWSDFRNQFLHIDSLHQYIDDNRSWISEAIDRNFTRWDNHIGESIWIEPDPIPQSYEEEIIYLKNWISERVAWLDEHIPGNCDQDIVYNNNYSSHSSDFEVYPNPTSGIITIRSNVDYPSDFRLFDVFGTVHYQGTIRQEQEFVDISRLPNNIYFLQIGEQTKRVILLH